MNLVEIIKKCIKQKTLLRTSGTVISYDKNTGFAIIKLRDYNNVEKRFLNKTGEILETDDEVWIHYWGSLNTGYIALRNGKPKPLGGNGLEVETAVVISNDISTTNGYLDNAKVYNIDVQNQIKTVYGSGLRERVVIGGNLCLYNPNVRKYFHTDFQTYYNLNYYDWNIEQFLESGYAANSIFDITEEERKFFEGSIDCISSKFYFSKDTTINIEFDSIQNFNEKSPRAVIVFNFVLDNYTYPLYIQEKDLYMVGLLPIITAVNLSDKCFTISLYAVAYDSNGKLVSITGYRDDRNMGYNHIDSSGISMVATESETEYFTNLDYIRSTKPSEVFVST